ncbi:PA14 domain-containing protein [Ideonella sp.]|uniref:PA14 domain-containing protein n=1 Tax=Ideonella sp. TaxID=1929293 RepID=UPI002B46AC53|nr:PA14 domain-containing protein [Ideonella sp.]HJV72569.1 PA14 domain-containing protein [Ideonella sp.]
MNHGAGPARWRHRPAHTGAAVRRCLPAMLAAALLASSCGGGDEPTPAARSARPDAATAPAPSAARRMRALAAPNGKPIPPDAAQKGMFSPLYNWPLIAIHTALLPDGRVMSYGTDTSGRQTGYFVYDLWDSAQLPDAGHQTLPNNTATDLFCSSQVLVPLNGDGAVPQLVISNGDNWVGGSTTNTGNSRSSIFDPATNTLTRGQDTNRPRWYGTSTVLLNGEVYLQGGWDGTDRPEIRGANGSYRLLAIDTSALDFYYPRNFVAPDGRVFGFDSSGRMYFIDPAGGGPVQRVGQIPDGINGNGSSSAMFRPGRILQFGGFAAQSVVIDINGPSPVLSGQVAMSSQRQLGTATLLADGRVLATGGSPVWNELPGAALNAEIWNPQTGVWTLGAQGAVARLYHSTALLLPDATVLVAGGGAPGPLTNLNAEIYHPPYLFTADGQEAARPAIVGTPDFLQVGRTIPIDVASGSPIGRVVLVKTGSVTHSVNMDQRFVELPFRVDGSDPHRLYAQAPTHAGDVPPGYYLLFVLDTAGVPSTARILNLGVAAIANPEVTPVLNSPGNQDTPLGNELDLAVTATDPNGDALRFSAAGLPPGLAMNAATGHITGAPTATGSYDVVLGVTDGYNSASVNIVWQVSGSAPPQFEPLPPPTPALVGTQLDVSASASGYQIEFKWNFGDGTPDTPWLPDGRASHVYSRAGVFTVTVSVRDGAGRQIAQGFVQRVQLPVSGALPTQSSTIVAETPAGGGNPRLWVVNPDSDSVSVFDAVSRTRLAEITVGASPRSLARAGDGRIWVANQRGASLSVIDPASLSVAATLMLPRASQPQAIVMSPAGTQAFVTLAASGQLLRLDTATFAQTGALALGPQPGGLAVSGDGATVYVVRFVTAPLPGEATATVTPGPSTGGEIRVVDAAAMSLLRSIVLQHSDRPDAENQGRGIPNYLGAPALSPDGTQAFVPSKQDNVLRGQQRDGLALNFQNTVRAVSSRIVLATQQEDLAGRIDHDNAGLASAALFDPTGVFLFVALETSREVAVLDAHSRQQLLRLDAGRAPQGLALSPDGLTLFASNFMDRTVSAFDLKPLLLQGQLSVPALGPMNTIATEPLAPAVLLGKQLFYDARDPRLARDGYLSCAACHRDGGSDGRVWDMADAGEGLRNTINLRGRAAMGQGLLHWSGNFDELQDFEGQIRRLAGGTGLMSDAAYFAGTRSQPLGDLKAGLSAELDALAAYVASLAAFDASPWRGAGGAPSTAAMAGREVFRAQACGACHGGAGFTLSATLGLQDVGTIKPTSGQRLGGPLVGIDIPTLRDVWASAPYLHDGSAATLEAAVSAHRGVVLGAGDLANLVAYLRELGSDEAGPPVPGTGLAGRYFNNKKLAGTPVLTRTEAVDFDWGTGSAGPGVRPDAFSVRWAGTLEVPVTGVYTFQTVSDDGLRLWVNGVRLIANWTSHTATTNASKKIKLAAGQRVPLQLDYFDNTGAAEIRLRWKPPGTAGYVAVPAEWLYPE